MLRSFRDSQVHIPSNKVSVVIDEEGRCRVTLSFEFCPADIMAAEGKAPMKLSNVPHPKNQ